MKVFNYLSVLLLFVLIGLSSCTKEEISTTEVITEPVQPAKEHVNGLITRSVSFTDGLELGCVSVNYPFQMSLLDGTIIDINSEEDFIAALEDGDPDNPLIDFVYPLTVTDEDDNESTVNNADELGELFIDCVPDTGWDDTFPDWFFPAWDISYDNSCYQLVYPLDLLDMDSMTVTANDEAELISLLSDGNIYSFNFPLELEDEDGNSVTADDAEDLFDLLADCGPGPGSGGCGIGTFACYDISYPINLVLLDGTTVTANNDDEFAELMMTVEWAGFGFPMNLIDEDGNVITINNDEELSEALLACDGFGGGPGGGGPSIDGDFICYDFVYPISVVSGINETTVLNNSDEWFDAQMTGSFMDFVYPFDVINSETGEESTINDPEELVEAIEDCF